MSLRIVASNLKVILGRTLRAAIQKRMDDQARRRNMKGKEKRTTNTKERTRAKKAGNSQQRSPRKRKAVKLSLRKSSTKRKARKGRKKVGNRKAQSVNKMVVMRHQLII